MVSLTSAKRLAVTNAFIKVNRAESELSEQTLLPQVGMTKTEETAVLEDQVILSKDFMTEMLSIREVEEDKNYRVKQQQPLANRVVQSQRVSIDTTIVDSIE